MIFITILWSKDVAKFDIVEHQQLKDAVVYLIQHGAEYQNQKIVTEVDWLPKDVAQAVIPTTKEIDPGPPPGTVMSGVDAPQVIDPTGAASGGYRPTKPGQRSIFEGILPPQLLGTLAKDD